MTNDPAANPSSPEQPTTTVVICAYTMDRITELRDAIDSVKAQDHQPDEIVVVVDFNDDLLANLADVDGIVLTPNLDTQGLSGARNTGVQVSRGELLAFLDDDAVASANWLRELIAPFGDHTVDVTGGRAVPNWLEGRPGWFPDTFGWVIGCSFEGQTIGEARNPIGCNMAIRRSAIERVGGFNAMVGRTATSLAGGEETQLAIQIRDTRPESRVIVLDAAEVHHAVPGSRGTWKYFLRRCLAEGSSKAVVFDHTGDEAASVEQAYLTKVLPRSVVRAVAGGNPTQAVAIVAGTGATGYGFINQKIRTAIEQRRSPS